MIKAADVTPGARVAALSLWEPWATLMALGAKKIETRSWPTSHRGALLICASVRKNKKEMDKLLGYDPEYGPNRETPFWSALKATSMSYGHAVALVDLHDCMPTDRFRPSPVSDEWEFGNYGPDRFAWITTGLRRLKPFPVKGKQGIFYVTMPDDFEDFEP